MDIKQLRKDKNLTQRQLAKLCRVSLTTVQNWEAGTSTPNEENQSLLCGVLNIKDEKDGAKWQQ